MLSDVLGLTPEESASYRALVSMGAVTPAQLASPVGCDPAEAARILGTLDKRGLATHSLDDSSKYVAAPPATALRAILVERQNELNLAEIELHAVDELYRAATTGQGAGVVVEVIHGADVVRERLGQMRLGARKEILNLVKAPFFSDTNLTDRALIQRGVAYRTILEREVLEGGDSWFDEIVRARAAGEDVRIAEAVPVKLFVVDREYAFAPLGSDGAVEGGGALLVRASSLLDALIALFEDEWGKAMQVVTSVGGAGETSVLDDVDVQVLSLALTGLTDEAIAVQLRTSMRTVQRRIRRLMDLVDVRNRMQLGFQAARRGWLDGSSSGA